MIPGLKNAMCFPLSILYLERERPKSTGPCLEVSYLDIIGTATLYPRRKGATISSPLVMMKAANKMKLARMNLIVAYANIFGFTSNA